MVHLPPVNVKAEFNRLGKEHGNAPWHPVDWALNFPFALRLSIIERMDLDDTVCFCFHVTHRKLRNYAKLNKPKVASLMTECYGAGTGCGWCRPIVIKIWETYGQEKPGEIPTLASLAERKANREQYWLDKFGKKPASGDKPAESKPEDSQRPS